MLRLFIVCASCATAGTLLVALVPACRGPFFVVPWSVAQSALVLETCPSVVRFVFQRPLYVEMLEDPLSDDDMQPDEIQFRRKLRTGFDHLLIMQRSRSASWYGLGTMTSATTCRSSRSSASAEPVQHLQEAPHRGQQRAPARLPLPALAPRPPPPPQQHGQHRRRDDGQSGDSL